MAAGRYIEGTEWLWVAAGKFIVGAGVLWGGCPAVLGGCWSVSNGRAPIALIGVNRLSVRRPSFSKVLAG